MNGRTRGRTGARTSGGTGGRTRRAVADAGRLALLLVLAALALALPRAAAAAGPPFPDPVDGQRVYDRAGVFSAAALADARATIAAIEQRTGAQVVVYTQVAPGATNSSVRDDAQALGDQWGVGRKGFDDGLVLLFDMDATGQHGKVAFVGGSGFRAAYLDDAATQRILDDTMVPLLRDGDFDGALAAGLAKVDAGTSPEAAAGLQVARTANSILGLVVGPLLLLLLAGWAVLRWYRAGRDPVYVDSPSIYLPAPPDGLTAATGALVLDGRSSRRALTTALLDLASRDEIAFVKHARPRTRDTLGIEIRDPTLDDPQVRLNRRAPVGPGEARVREALAAAATPGDGGERVVEGARLLEFGTSVSSFEKDLEQGAVDHGWFADRPAGVKARWMRVAFVEGTAALVVFILARTLPSSGLAIIAACVLVAAIITGLVARSMPARTRAGAMTRAMLAAYRRTLAATMAQARSMDAVAAEPRMAWLETPDRAVVWATALGLADDVQRVFDRTTADMADGRAAPSAVYHPAWYLVPSGGQPGGAAGVAPGMLSASALPDLGGMLATLGTIGNTPASSGSGGMGGGGGFSGGSSGSF